MVSLWGHRRRLAAHPYLAEASRKGAGEQEEKDPAPRSAESPTAGRRRRGRGLLRGSGSGGLLRAGGRRRDDRGRLRPCAGWIERRVPGAPAAWLLVPGLRDPEGRAIRSWERPVRRVALRSSPSTPWRPPPSGGGRLAGQRLCLPGPCLQVCLHLGLPWRSCSATWKARLRVMIRPQGRKDAIGSGMVALPLHLLGIGSALTGE